MSFKRSLTIRVMLNRFHQGAPDLILDCLPKELAQQVLEVDVPSQDASLLLDESKDLVQKVHYSWLIPVIRQFPSSVIPIVLSSLPKSTAIQLSETLKVPLLEGRVAVSMRLHMLSQVAARLKPENILPAVFLPTTILSPMLNMHKSELVQLIDFLGLYDLAEEIRHIVDRKYLNAIYSCLSIKKQHFLRICLHQKQRLSIPRLGLDKWQGDSKILEGLMHKRGLLRLGKGISGQHPDFFWHLMHKLDTGRGQILEQYYSKEDIPGVTQVLLQEILNLMNFFKKNE